MASNVASPPSPMGLRLLSLDGGGVRGLSALYILRNLMEKINPASPPLPCNYFDMIGGTSTGGIIAVMLGRLRMSVNECIKEYSSLSKKVFIKKNHRISIPKFKTQARFDTSALEEAIKKVLADRMVDEDELLKSDGPCKVFVCASGAKSKSPVCLRSYQTSRGATDLLDCTRIWEACRATSAAPTFFKPVVIGPHGEKFVDGGLGRNNPVEILWTEAQDVFGSREVQCLISIGMGLPSGRAYDDTIKDLITALKGIATDTEDTADKFHRNHGKDYYYRFSVNRGLDIIGLEEADRMGEIADATRRYIESQEVYSRLETCADLLAGRKTHSPPSQTVNHTAKKHHLLPHFKNYGFVGREDELKNLQQLLFSGEQLRQIVALSGLGGVGKTQIANAFAYWTKDTRPDCSIFWVRADSKPNFEEAYMAIATKLGILSESTNKDVKKLVCDHLSSEAAGEWLLVIDNLDDPHLVEEPGLQEFFPQSDTGRVLVTTRKQDIATRVAQNTIHLEVFSLPQAKELARTHCPDELVDIDEPTMDAFMEELGYLPLAITQAMAYIKKIRMRVSNYLELLRKSEDDKTTLLSRLIPSSTHFNAGTHAVATTWLVSFRQLEEQSLDAVELLKFISEIQPKSIPLSLLPDFGSEAARFNVVTHLCDYGFVSWQDNDMIGMHSLVHMVTRNWVKQSGEEKRKKVADDALQHMSSLFPDPAYENRDTWRAYLPHALHMFHNGEAVKSREAILLYVNVSWALRYDGRYGEALPCAQACEKWAYDHLPEEDEERLAVQHMLAILYEDNKQVSEAISLLKHVVGIEETKLAEDYPDRLASQHALARAYLDNNQIQEAILLLEHVVRVEEKKLPEDHPSRLTSQHELARAYLANNQISQAIELLEHVVRVREKNLAEDYPDRLASQHTLARAYLANNQISQAIKLLEHVVRVREKKLAEDYPDRLASQHMLARAYLANNQISQAIKLLEHVVRVEEKKLPEDDPSRLISQHELARAYVKNNQIQEAKLLLEHVVRVQEKKLAEDHPDRLVSQHALANAYLKNNQISDAILLLEHVVRVKEKLLEDDPSLLAS